MSYYIRDAILWFQNLVKDWNKVNQINNDGFFDPVYEQEEKFSVLTHPSYDQIHEACEHIAETIKESQFVPDKIIGLARGGLLPAVILSHMLDVPMRCVHYSSKDGKGDDKNHFNELPEINGKNILIVDDICDSGKTLAEVFKEYTMRKHVVYSTVLYHKESAVFTPDVYWHWIPKDSPWIIFPFEK